MSGFELRYKDKIYSAAIGQKCISVIISRVHDKTLLNFGGSDFENSLNMTWIDSQPETGDHITILIKENIEETHPIETRPATCKKKVLSEEGKTTLQEYELKRYYNLKELLTRKGLI